MWWPFELDQRLDKIQQTVNTILKTLTAMQRKEQQMSAALDDLRAEVTEMDSVVQSVLALITGLVDQLKNATTDAEIQEVITSLEAEKNLLADAVAANTPVQPAV
jgi:signal recognition particle GTPase